MSNWYWSIIYIYQSNSQDSFRKLNMSTGPGHFNGQPNLGYVSDEITELPGTVSANDDNGTILEETKSAF